MRKKNISIFNTVFMLMFTLLINNIVLGDNKNIKNVEHNNIVHTFLSVGGMKTVRNTPLKIRRLDLTIEIEKNYEVRLKNEYELENISDYNVKSTFMFPIDINIENNVGYNQTNIKNEYIKNIQFTTDYKKNKYLRAVINFDELIYDNQKSLNIQRDWYAVSNTIKSNDIENIIYSYVLMNTGIEHNNSFVYSYDLTTNFANNNIADIFILTIINKSDKVIENVQFNGYFIEKEKKSRSEIYKMAFTDVKLIDKIYIQFK